MITPVARPAALRRALAAHGERGRYAYWRCRCGPCSEANRLYAKRHREHRATSAFVDPTGTLRRVQGLVAMGFTFTAIGEVIGTSVSRVGQLARDAKPRGVLRSTERRVRLATHLLLAGPLPRGRAASVAKAIAAKEGWLPLGVWDNIDDPASQPAYGRATSGDDDLVDEVAVRRVCDGHAHIDSLTPSEQVAAVQWMASRGVSRTQMAREFGVGAGRLNGLLSRAADGRGCAA